MKYQVTETFMDRLLNAVIRAGTEYPPKGEEVPAEWVAKLAGADNAVGRPFIRMIETEQAEPTENMKAVVRAAPRKKK